MHIETQVSAILSLVAGMAATLTTLNTSITQLTQAVSQNPGGTAPFDSTALIAAVNANTAAVQGVQATVTQLQADLEVDESATAGAVANPSTAASGASTANASTQASGALTGAASGQNAAAGTAA